MAETTPWVDRACTKCDRIQSADGFHADKTHADGRTSVCKACRNGVAKARYSPKGPPTRYGPVPKPGRDGDKAQARARVNQQVQRGARPHPNSLPCTDCGHIWEPSGRRHEYDHHKGYSAEHQLDVEPVCTTCHVLRDSAQKRKTTCSRGHAYNAENTILKSNGTRWCRECRRAFDRNRTRPPGYWKAVNDRRRSKNDNARPEISR